MTHLKVSCEGHRASNINLQENLRKLQAAQVLHMARWQVEA